MSTINPKLGFVHKVGHELILDGKIFRFAGPNIYWLGIDENVGGVDYPTQFRIHNVLDTAVEMGATALRSHTIAASHGHPKAIEPELGVFNEESLKRVDFVMKSIADRDLKVFIPLVDNWNYYHGGRETFIRWRGLTNSNEFYKNRKVIDDFKEYISRILNRVNTYTGIAYKDDPTVLAWEVGNELVDAPLEWVEEIVNFIKSIDTNHLVAYGNRFGLDEDKMSIEDLDILDAHYYPVDSEKLNRDANIAKRKNKVFIAGEFGWPEGDLERFLEVAIKNQGVSGTFYWSLFGHNDDFGYVQHYDSFSLHYPGDFTNKERFLRIQSLRKHGFDMSGKDNAKHSIPKAPIITEITGSIKWRGVVGAACYTIEKSMNGESGPWKVVCEKNVSDDHSIWIDSERDQLKDTWYRIKAYNLSGVEGPYSDIYHSFPMFQSSSLNTFKVI